MYYIYWCRDLLCSDVRDHTKKYPLKPILHLIKCSIRLAANYSKSLLYIHHRVTVSRQMRECKKHRPWKAGPGAPGLFQNTAGFSINRGARLRTEANSAKLSKRFKGEQMIECYCLVLVQLFKERKV